MILKARFVVPVDSPVIENGAVVIDDGRITAVGPAHELSAGKTVDYGDAVILPGLVNAHTHLELSLLAGRVPPTSDFIDWLQRLIALRAADLSPELRASEPGASATGEPPPLQRGDTGGTTSDSRAERSPGAPGTRADSPAYDNPIADYVTRAVRRGVVESVSSGITTLGDITAMPQWTRPALTDSPLRVVSFGEVIAMGTGRAHLAERLERAANLDHQTQTLHVGLSPHAPYTVEPDALRACADRARQIGAPLCIHVAETREEEMFTRDRAGPFADFLRRLGLWDEQIPRSGCTPVELCAAAGLLGPETLLAHANYVSDADIAAIAASRASVAYCPRTHEAFGHDPHRFRDMLRAGVNVCLGTDSLASSPSLSILDELRFLRMKCHDVAPSDLLAMATLRGAGALGFADITGSITPGKSADLVVIPLIPSKRAAWESFLDSAAIPLAVYIDGTRRSASFYC
jgi:cytosine/adenosine deaminase-related metal-dependent hydrolase